MKKILTFLLAIVMTVSTAVSNVTIAQAATEQAKLEDGTYYVELTELPKKDGGQVYYNSFNVAPRAALTVNNGSYYLQLRIYGYNHWNVVKFLSQEGYSKIDNLKAGTDWTDYKKNEMTGYAEKAAKAGNEETNPYWSTVDQVKKKNTDKKLSLIHI